MFRKYEILLSGSDYVNLCVALEMRRKQCSEVLNLRSGICSDVSADPLCQSHAEELEFLNRFLTTIYDGGEIVCES